MSNATQNDATGSVDHQIQTKLAELAELISVQQYGSDGPPKDLTFCEIEQAGYEAAQLAAAKFETTVTDQQQHHFNGPQPCPGCGQHCQAEDPVERELLTRLGPVKLSEIKFHCNACRRSFFPSA